MDNKLIDSPQQMDAFLSDGCLMEWGSESYLVGYNLLKTSAFPDPQKISFYAPDFYLENNQPWRIYENVGFVKNIPSWLAILKKNITPPPSVTWQEPNLEVFKKNFAEIQTLIEKKELKKAVPVVFEHTSLKVDKSLLSFFLTTFIERKLSAPNSNTWAYGFWKNGEGLLGVTPELLFDWDLKEKVIKTMALAATRLSEDPRSLLQDTKEMQEHNLVIDSILQKTKIYGEAQLEATEEVNFGLLTHLKTNVYIPLKHDLEWNTLVERMHPTSALGTHPASEWKILKKFDLEDRQFLGAPFGAAIPGERGRCVVAIRNLRWQTDGARVGSGCGIVNQSVVENEWRELKNKRMAVKKSLGL